MPTAQNKAPRASRRRQSAGSTLFNFERVNGLVFRDERITISPSVSADRLITDPVPANVLATFRRPASSVTFRETTRPRRTRHNLPEPLPDSLYLPFHRRLKRDETLMTNADVLRLLLEIDKLRDHLRILHSLEWSRHLPSVTIVNDRTDSAEMDRKRSLTVLEIERLIASYELWCGRQDALRAENRLLDTQNVASDDDDVFAISLDQLKKRRHREKVAALPRVKIDLGNGFCIYSEPAKDPAIVPFEEDSSTSSNAPVYGNLKRRVIKKDAKSPIKRESLGRSLRPKR